LRASVGTTEHLQFSFAGHGTAQADNSVQYNMQENGNLAALRYCRSPASHLC
jgi:hypothetical protein